MRGTPLMLSEMRARKMPQISPKALVDFVRSQGDLRLSTRARKCWFTARAVKDGLEYVPDATQMPRRHQMKWLARVCEHFNQTQSLHPSDYKHLSRNASYTLALIEAYQNRQHL